MSLDPLEQQLLQNIHEGMSQLTRDHIAVMDRLGRIETNQEDILGNGQPGRLSKVETSVKSLESFTNRAKGAFAVIGFMSGGSLVGLYRIWSVIAPHLR